MSTNLLEKTRGDKQLTSSVLESPAWPAPVSGPPTTDPWQTTVSDLFRAVVYQHPDAVAVSDVHGSLTYAGLWNLAAAFRDELVARGVVPGDRVGIAAARSIPTVAAILGVVLAGGCYVPIDIDNIPAAILTQLAEHSELRGWIADRNARHSAVASLWGALPVIALEEVSAPAGNSLASVPAAAIGPETPLYVMFTSGSTGLPKGVLVPHRAVVRLVVGQDFIEFGPRHTFLLHSPLTFDASTLEFWGPLLHGGRLAVAPAHRLSIHEYAKILVQQRVTTLWLTAAVFHLAAEHAPDTFAPLDQLLFGGDVIAPRSVERVRALYPGLRMVNGYGPTENTTFTCCYVVPGDYRPQGSLPIGVPIAHTTTYVLDAARRPVAAGQEGELATGGAGVALGYLNRPEATAERFLPDPCSQESGALLYLTGDRVRQLPDGAIEFLGRADNQVKIAGQRVELDAVESAIAASPLVAEAAVIVLAPAGVEKQLAAGVSLLHPAENAEFTLRLWLGERLSRAAIPQHWVFLDKLPINANGKLDRAALRAECEKRLRPDATPALRPEANSRELASVAQITEHLQQMWGGLLHRASVGSEENFFDLGGTSLLLIEMHSRLKIGFASVPSMVDMFAFPTPRALAERLYVGGEVSRAPSAAEARGQRQRSAMLSRRRVPVAPRNVLPAAAPQKDGCR